jgi:hypothetical protein
MFDETKKPYNFALLILKNPCLGVESEVFLKTFINIVWGLAMAEIGPDFQNETWGNTKAANWDRL